MKRIVVASGNRGKIKEIKELMPDYEVLSMEDMGYEGDIEETGTTFLENALIKAKAVYQATKIPTVADDSGLVVDCLGGKPGIYSARFEKTDALRKKKLLSMMEGAKDRSAHFTCAAVYYYGENKFLSAEGRVEGVILDREEGSNGFGYDSVFYSTELKKSFGTATDEEKNTISHRARAFEKLAEQMKKI